MISLGVKVVCTSKGIGTIIYFVKHVAIFYASIFLIMIATPSASSINYLSVFLLVKNKQLVRKQYSKIAVTKNMSFDIFIIEKKMRMYQCVSVD